jgi:hypothetical protein
MDIDLKSTHYTEALPVAPLTVADVAQIAPVGVHIKELNQLPPLLVESLRVDHVRHVDPLRIEQLDVTGLPTVNITLSQLPALDINVRRVPPVAIAIQQQFEMSSAYSITARLLGLPFLTMALSGRTTITPRDCAWREESRSHERSFPDVAAAGNPALRTHATETCVTTVSRRAPPPRAGVHPGAPRFGFSLRADAAPSTTHGSVNGG